MYQTLSTVANDWTPSITSLEAHSARRGVLFPRIRDSAARPPRGGGGGGGLCIAVALDLSEDLHRLTVPRLRPPLAVPPEGRDPDEGGPDSSEQLK